MMDKVHRSSDSECYTPPPEPFIFYKYCAMIYGENFKIRIAKYISQSLAAVG
jgi:hypothetical protein